MMKDFKLQLSLTATVMSDKDISDVDTEQLAQQLNWRFSDHHDGRLPFSVELIREGLASLFVGSLRDAVERPFRVRHGNRIIGKHVVATYLGEKKCEGLSIYLQRDMTAGDIRIVEAHTDDDLGTDE